MSEGLQKSVRSFLIGLAGVSLTYVSQWATGTDWGSLNAVIIPAVSMLVDLLRRQIPVEVVNPK